METLSQPENYLTSYRHCQSPVVICSWCHFLNNPEYCFCCEKILFPITRTFCLANECKSVHICIINQCWWCLLAWEVSKSDLDLAVISADGREFYQQSVMSLPSPPFQNTPPAAPGRWGPLGTEWGGEVRRVQQKVEQAKNYTSAEIFMGRSPYSWTFCW